METEIQEMIRAYDELVVSKELFDKQHKSLAEKAKEKAMADWVQKFKPEIQPSQSDYSQLQEMIEAAETRVAREMEAPISTVMDKIEDLEVQIKQAVVSLGKTMKFMRWDVRYFKAAHTYNKDKVDAVMAAWGFDPVEKGYATKKPAYASFYKVKE